jgi:hypothetical protein
MTNVQFIAKFLKDNPGSGSVAVRRALCDSKGKPFLNRYGWYFGECASQYGYWKKVGRGWYLTPAGEAKIG